MKSKFLLFIAVILLTSCNSEQYNIYNHFPKGSKLTKKIVMKAEKFISDDNYFIILVDDSKDIEYHNSHMLFYGKDLKLRCASYLPGSMDSISKGIIYGELNTQQNERKSWFVNELPTNYKLNLFESKVNNSTSQFNKRINEITIAKVTGNVIIIANISEDPQIGYDVLDGYPVKEGTKTDTIVLSQSEINFFKKNGKLVLSTVKVKVSEDTAYVDYYLISDELLVSYYNQLWNFIIENKKQ